MNAFLACEICAINKGNELEMDRKKCLCLAFLLGGGAGVDQFHHHNRYHSYERQGIWHCYNGHRFRYYMIALTHLHHLLS